MNPQFDFYIHSDILDSSNFTDDKVKLFFKTIFPVIEIGRQLKADIYYQERDVSMLRDFFNELPDDFKTFNKTYADRLDILLEDCLKTKEISHLFEVQYNNDQSQIIHRSEFSHLTKNSEHKVTVVFSYRKEEVLNLLHIKSKNEFSPIQLNVHSKEKNIWKFINDVIKNSSKSRIFNEAKHGTIEKPAHKSNKGKFVSQLKCSPKRAQELLDSAICDFRENKNRLFNFDEEQSTYIEFFDENALNQFHGFHLELKDWNRVPDSIKKHFEK